MTRSDPHPPDPTAGQIKTDNPELADLLAPLADADPVTVADLAGRVEPGHPLDRLGAMSIILAALRREES